MDKSQKKTVTALVNLGTPKALLCASALLKEIANVDMLEEKILKYDKDIREFPDSTVLALRKRRKYACNSKLKKRTAALAEYLENATYVLDPDAPREERVDIAQYLNEKYGKAKQKSVATKIKAPIKIDVRKSTSNKKVN